MKNEILFLILNLKTVMPDTVLLKIIQIIGANDFKHSFKRADKFLKQSPPRIKETKGSPSQTTIFELSEKRTFVNQKRYINHSLTIYCLLIVTFFVDIIIYIR